MHLKNNRILEKANSSGLPDHDVILKTNFCFYLCTYVSLCLCSTSLINYS